MGNLKNSQRVLVTDLGLVLKDWKDLVHELDVWRDFEYPGAQAKENTY